jgi:hypothetical protein
MIKLIKNNTQVLLIFKFDYHNHMPDEILREINLSDSVYDIDEHNKFKVNVMKHPLEYKSIVKNKKKYKNIYFNDLLLMIALDFLLFNNKNNNITKIAKSRTMVYKYAYEAYYEIKSKLEKDFLLTAKVNLASIKYHAGYVTDIDYFFPKE